MGGWVGECVRMVSQGLGEGGRVFTTLWVGDRSRKGEGTSLGTPNRCHLVATRAAGALVRGEVRVGEEGWERCLKGLAEVQGKESGFRHLAAYVLWLGGQKGREEDGGQVLVALEADRQLPLLPRATVESMLVWQTDPATFPPTNPRTNPHPKRGASLNEVWGVKSSGGAVLGTLRRWFAGEGVEGFRESVRDGCQPPGAVQIRPGVWAKVWVVMVPGAGSTMHVDGRGGAREGAGGRRKEKDVGRLAKDQTRFKRKRGRY